MSYICVICTLNRPPLLPLAIEHRRLLEAIVSPVVNMMDLKSCPLLLCVDCQVKMLSIHQFQKTALQGIRNFKYLLSKVNHVRMPIQPVIRNEHVEVTPCTITIKIEPTDLPATYEESMSPEAKEESTHKMESHHLPELVTPVSQPVSDPANIEEETTNCKPPDQELKPSMKSIQTNVRNGITKEPENSVKTINSGRYSSRLRSSGVRKRHKITIQPTPLQCPHCDQKLSHAGSLRAHISRKHSETEPSKCDICGVTCRNAESLRYHRNQHKNVRVPGVPQIPEPQDTAAPHRHTVSRPEKTQVRHLRKSVRARHEPAPREPRARARSKKV